MIKEKKKSDIAIIKYSSNSGILFSTTVILAVAVSFFLVVLLIALSLSSSIFVFGADPGMAPSPQSPSAPPAPATTTGEKPGISPPSSSTTATTPPQMPKVEQKTDPKDGDIILSSKTDDGTTTVATKVDKKSYKKTNNFNRGLVEGVIYVLDHVPKMSEEQKKDFLKSYYSEDSEERLKKFGIRDDPFTPAEYRKGFLNGIKMGMEITDELWIDLLRGPPKKK